MITFEVGKTYTARSPCDHNCIFEIKVTKRTEKMVSYEYEGKTRRSKPYDYNGVEHICPEKYSMCAIFSADEFI